MKNIEGIVVSPPDGFPKISGVSVCVVSKYDVAPRPAGGDILFVLDSSGAMFSYSFSWRDSILAVTDHAKQAINSMTREFSAGALPKVVEIASRGGSLLVRFETGDFFEVIFHGIGEAKVISSDTDIVRITKHKAYKDKRKYFRSGPGGSALIPFIEDNILMVCEEPGGDATVFYENSKVKVSTAGTIVDADISRTVAGAIGGAIAYRTVSGYSLEGVGLNEDVVDFGKVKIEIGPFGPLGSSCCYAAPGTVKNKIYSELPETMAQYVIDNGEIHGCSWHGVGKLGHIIATCLDGEGFDFVPNSVMGSFIAEVGYYVDDKGVHFFPGGPGIMQKSGVRLLDELFSSGSAPKLNLSSSNTMMFLGESFHGLTLNFKSSRFTPMSDADWQALYE